MKRTPIHDVDQTVDIHEQHIAYSGAIWDVQRDTFTLPGDDQRLTREYIVHPGAVAIVVLDDEHRVAMIRQYRHPVGQECWEIPAGLLDEDGEEQVVTAQRELFEETDLVAKKWSVLVDHLPSAGSSSEAIRIFLAQEVSLVPEEQRHQRRGEEAQIVLQWVPLTEALEAVLSGAVKNVNAVAGILAAYTVINGDGQHDKMVRHHAD